MDEDEETSKSAREYEEVSEDGEDVSSEDEEDAEEDEDIELADEQDYINLYETDKSPPHEDFHEEFEISDVSYDLEDIRELFGKRWKIAKYKDKILKNFMVSEDMQLYSLKSSKIITEKTLKGAIHDDGEWACNFWIDGKTKRILLRDVLASTFLKTPKDVVLSVYRHWNTDNPNGKYHGQSKHYTNIRWLTENDLKDVESPEEKIKISIQGDLYSAKKGSYRFLKEKISSGVRKVRVQLNNKGKAQFSWRTYNLHELVAKHFVQKKNDNYKYLFFKNNNNSDIHYRNMIWVNTLTGTKGDKVKYFDIPKCPGYALSETNIPYSFKWGRMTRLKLQKMATGYNRLALFNSQGKRKFFMFSRIVAATRRDDFDPFLYVDHGDNIRDHDVPENLSSVTPKQNSQNIRDDYIRGKRIIQLNVQEDVIKVHDNAKTAALQLGNINLTDKIRRVARKNMELGVKTVNNYIWRYVEKREMYICKKGEYFIQLSGTFQGIEINYENYMISNFGNIIDVNKGYKKAYSDVGYPYVTLAKFFNREKENFYVHFLNALLFVPGRTEEKNEVHHKDENPLNYHPNNLEWVSHSENVQKSAYRNGIPVKKICMETGQVLGIYDSRADGAASCGKSKKAAGPIGKAINPNSTTVSAYGFYWEDIKQEDISKYLQLKRNQRQP